jgi:hypothetical protein
MYERNNKNTQAVHAKEGAQGRLWPSSAYTQQIEALKNAIGKKIYLVELKPGDRNMGVRLLGTAYELIAVTDFPRPDPAKGIAPHLILIDDSRGINLGRIVRITFNTPFNPPESDILYQDTFLMQRLLLRERWLSRASIAAKSKALLGRILGKTVDESIKGGSEIISVSDAPTNSTETKRPRQKPQLPR